jgi:hypothetical protein
MARIRSVPVGGMTRIVVAGALAAVDMRQLEYACADALAQDPLPLEIDLRRVTAMDRTAAAILDRLERRGARIIEAPE